MATRSPPFKNYSEWTTSRFFSFIRSALRAAWTRYPPKYQVLDLASRPYVGPDKRQKKEFQCAICKKWHKRTNIEVDHIDPAGSLKDYSDLPGFVERLFTSIDRLRCLCKPCHKIVTQEEKKKNKENQLDVE